MRLPTSWQPPGSQLMHIILQWIDTMGWREGMENCNIMMSSQAGVTRQDGSLPLMDHLTRLPLQPVLLDHSISFSLSLQWTRWTPLRYREQLNGLFPCWCTSGDIWLFIKHKYKGKCSDTWSSRNWLIKAEIWTMNLQDLRLSSRPREERGSQSGGEWWATRSLYSDYNLPDIGAEPLLGRRW